MTRRFLGLMAAGLLGCSGEVAHTDAAVGDGGAEVDATLEVDAGAPDGGPTGLVEVEVLGWLTMRGQPIVGAPVLFHDASGALVARETTGADGRASAEVEAGGSVTVIHFADDRLTTILGVEPGDQLVFGRSPGAGAYLGTATVELPAAGGDYRVRGPCLGGDAATTTVAVQLGDGCTATGPLLALSGPLEGIDGYLYDPAVTMTPGATITLAGPWQTPGAFGFDLTGFDIDYLTGTVGVVAGDRLVGAVSAPLPSPVGGVVDAALDAPTGVGEATLVAVSGQAPAGAQHTIVDLRDGQHTSIALDGAALLPHSTLTTGDATGATWSNQITDHDGTTIHFSSSSATWRVFGPPEATSVTLPALPDDLASFWEPTDDLFLQVTVAESTIVAGYDGFRAAPDQAASLSFEVPEPFRIRTTTTGFATKP